MGLLLRFTPAQHFAVDGADAPDTDHEYPLVLTTKRVRGDAASTGGSPVAELHPSTARRHGVAADGIVCVTTRRGSAVFTVATRDTIPEDTVVLCYPWGGGQAIGALTNRVLDPLSKKPEFKRCAVKVGPPAEKGTGSL